MDKDFALTALPIAALFAVFAVFMGVLYFRSRYNRTHPLKPSTPASRQRTRIRYTVVLSACWIALFYLDLRRDHFVLSWPACFWLALTAFTIGAMLGHRNGYREAALDRQAAEQSEPASAPRSTI